MARQLLVLQALLVVVLVVGGVVLSYLDAKRTAEERATQSATAVARTIADAPSVRSALRLPQPSVELQPFAERVRADADVDFVTIMDPTGIRHTHPTPAQIGQRFLGNTAEALRGGTVTETYTGTLGPSIRAVVPVLDGDRVTALVAVGITLSAVSAGVADRMPAVLGVAAVVLAIGVGGSSLVSARLRRQTRGMAPAELAGMFAYYEAILHSVREGLLLVGQDHRVALCNDAARELLELEIDPVGLSVSELRLDPALAAALDSDTPRADELHVTGSRVLVLNSSPVHSGGRAQGNVITLRDHTELQELSGELNAVRGFTESLRSQAHESANRLHTVVSLVELGRTEQAVEFATAELRAAQQLTDRVVGAVAEPVVAALLLGKSAEAAERGIELELTGDTAMSDTAGADARDLVTILGNLVDNALDAAAEAAAERAAKVTVTVREEDGELLIRVADTGAGVPDRLATRIFQRGFTTKEAGGHGLGLALVGQAVHRAGGTVSVGRDVGAVFTVRLPRAAR
ncbi:sensor histidine kinase [Herbihabitans rhizosphaerae]|uniref:sensor histidine kinase n=1 Tax=Herbihabitans rhizosphaerae TaxID=1872711 RepID=UPI0013EECB24|nr:sensor histidine kinase [Herbihabitans rhizosphaerae]